jgi:hypothetical protein
LIEFTFHVANRTEPTLAVTTDFHAASTGDTRRARRLGTDPGSSCRTRLKGRGLRCTCTARLGSIPV